ncbi:MAG: hypothetical protein NTX64_03470 [Elusimicrobia bacterium]|nr:hypothetical protein [Elusimicrobiota bacterium]
MPYYVYVVALDPAVKKSARFRDRNPGLASDAPCYYVGQSAHEPDCRYRQHKECHGPVIRFSCICAKPLGDFSRNLSNRYVREYGRFLKRELYEHHNPMRTRAEAERREAGLASELRAQGCGVWWG